MDAGIADTLNRRTAWRITTNLDVIDWFMGILGDKTPEVGAPWYRAPIADTLMGTNAATSGDRAWLVGIFAARTPNLGWDGHPADCDWDNLFSHFRAEILARRDPQSHPARAAEIPARDGVGSR
jgi:hypothetical protein